MRGRCRPWIFTLLLLASLDVAAKGKSRSGQSDAARAALASAVVAGDLRTLRIGWTCWPTRDASLTVQVERGRLKRFGPLLKGGNSERPLSDGEQKTLLAALRQARAERLVWVDRDVKNDRDRVLNLDVVSPGGKVLLVGAFVRIGATWRSGPTAALAELLESWLALPR